jgi:hypothetical protein
VADRRRGRDMRRGWSPETRICELLDAMHLRRAVATCVSLGHARRLRARAARSLPVEGAAVARGGCIRRGRCVRLRRRVRGAGRRRGSPLGERVPRR